jgi:hypothetical protein
MDLDLDMAVGGDGARTGVGGLRSDRVRLVEGADGGVLLQGVGAYGVGWGNTVSHTAAVGVLGDTAAESGPGGGSGQARPRYLGFKGRKSR